MNESKVIIMTVKENQLHGLTNDGYLAVYDADIGNWVARGSNIVVNPKKANELKSASFMTPEVPTRGAPVVKYVPSKWERFMTWLRSFGWRW